MLALPRRPGSLVDFIGAVDNTQVSFTRMHTFVLSGASPDINALGTFIGVEETAVSSPLARPLRSIRHRSLPHLLGKWLLSIHKTF